MLLLQGLVIKLDWFSSIPASINYRDGKKATKPGAKNESTGAFESIVIDKQTK